MKQAEIVISGKVQGVGFRYSAQSIASGYGLRGYVKNLVNGSVFVLAQGEESDLEAFIAWCHKGPVRSRVEEVIVEWEESDKEFSNFDIR